MVFPSFYQSCSVFGDCKLAFVDIAVERRMGAYSTCALDYGTEERELLFWATPFSALSVRVFSPSVLKKTGGADCNCIV